MSPTLSVRDLVCPVVKYSHMDLVAQAIWDCDLWIFRFVLNPDVLLRNAGTIFDLL